MAEAKVVAIEPAVLNVPDTMYLHGFVDLASEKVRVVDVIGRRGTGKTTTVLNLIATLDHVDELLVVGACNVASYMDGPLTIKWPQLKVCHGDGEDMQREIRRRVDENLASGADQKKIVIVVEALVKSPAWLLSCLQRPTEYGVHVFMVAQCPVNAALTYRTCCDMVVLTDTAASMPYGILQKLHHQYAHSVPFVAFTRALDKVRKFKSVFAAKLSDPCKFMNVRLDGKRSSFGVLYDLLTVSTLAPRENDGKSTLGALGEKATRLKAQLDAVLEEIQAEVTRLTQQ